MKHELNGIGTHLVYWKTRDLPRFVWAGISLFGIFYVATRFLMDEKPYQIIMYMWSFIIPFLISVIVPLNLRKKIKKVIQKIEFTDNKIEIETQNGVSFIKNIEIIKVRNRFSGFGENYTNGYILKNVDNNKEYWLIETFYNDFEDIESEISLYINENKK